MFRSKSHGDIKRLAKKFLDVRKSNTDRFKYLKNVVGIGESDGFATEDVKGFFEQHYQHVYYVFYEMFIYVDQERRVKGPKVHKDDFDGLLVLFEQIFVLLPRLVQRRWQFHSIRRLLKQLLHSGNSMKVRKDGVRLYIMWYQILQGHNDTENHEIFSKLVALYEDSEVFLAFSDVTSVPSVEMPVVPVEIHPLAPAGHSDKRPSRLHKFLMESVLTFMVSEVVKIHWGDTPAQETFMQETAFRFLFTSFKTYYLNVIFPNFDIKTSVYSVQIDHLPDFGTEFGSPYIHVLEDCQDVVIRWFTTFVQASPSFTPTETSKDEPTPSEVSDLEAEGGTLKDGDASTLENKAATLTNGSVESTTASAGLDGLITDNIDLSVNQHDIVCKVLLGDRDNINIVHEVFRQAFMLPLTHAGAVRRVVLVYKDWLQVPEKRPTFMEEPSNPPTDEVRSLSGKDFTVSGGKAMDGNSDLVRAGLQNSLLLFIKHSAFVFMINPSKDSLSMQDSEINVDLCRRVLNIYRYMVMNITLDTKTWEQLLRVLLKVTSYVLGQDDTLLGKHLAASLFQTLVVSWIKANLCIHMSEDLWDQLLTVLSALCHWEELIKEWAKTMETLTRVLAKQVYKLNLSDLPLDRLSEQKSKRQRGKMPPIARSDSKKGTFSRAYSRFDSATAFRAQLLSRSATQDSESTIIDERDSVDGESGPASVNRGHSFTETINSIPPLLTRSSSDGDLSGSLDKLKVGSTVTLVSSERDVTALGVTSATPSSVEENGVQDIVEPTTVEEYDHIPMSISDEISPIINHTSHSSSSENSRCSPDDSSLLDDFCLLAQRRKITGFDGDGFVSSEKRVGEVPASNGAVRTNKRLNSETTSSLVSESEMSEETGSMVSLSDGCESIPTLSAADSARSRSSSPTSNDLSHYLPDDMASFLKHDSIATSSVIFDNESLKHAPSFDNEGISIEELGPSGKSPQGHRSVLTGGQIPGWTPDVAVVLWKRMLGILGDINKIEIAQVHEKVMEHLLELQETLFKLSDNINVSADNTQSLDPAEISAPVSYFFPVCFKCLSLGEEYQKSKVVALQMLAKICLRHDYSQVSPDILAKFYQLLHRTLISTEQPLVDTLVRYCTPLLFGLDLPGANLFILDVLNAATSVLSLESIRMVPRREAITLLGTLVCIPNHFGSIDVLTQGNSSRNEMEADQLKEMVLAVLLDAGRKEPAGLARCVALSSLGIFLVEEMLSGEKHSKFRDAVNVLLVSLRFNTKLVAWVACDMLMLLSDFVLQLTEFEAGLPVKIVSTIAATFHNHVFSQTSLDDNLVISIMFCLLRWCMNLPLADLTKVDEQGKCLIGKVLKILQVVSAGVDKHSHGTPGLSQEYDLESMMSVAVCTNSPMKSLQRSEAVEYPEYEGDSVSYAARFVMRHLVNLVNHFPANSNPTHTYTSLQECNDLGTSCGEMNKEVFDSPNLQMFVFNRATLITVMEMDKQDIACTVEAANVSRTTARVLIRDLTGKYSSSGTMVYERQTAPTTHERMFSQSTITDSLFDTAEVGTITDAVNNPLPPSDDPLDKILRHVGESSTECQLQPGEPLDKPFDAVDEQTGMSEEEVRGSAALHEQEELIARSDQKTDFRLQVERMRATQHTPSTFPYTVCRQLLNQLGYLSWETRQNYYLLKKSDKLLREVKHLDAQSCRETHKLAVVYVANGHEDKQSILSNSSASSAFERFISGLGWEVDLATHEGFMGGLQRNGTNGATAPYYCTSTLEIMYHVSTRMPATTEEDRHRKLRHIGNDEIHIVWSEHHRPYRRGIIPTEFGDVILIIYPLKCGLFRIQIDNKAEVPYFGPLFDGAIVSERVLPVLVRYTAINASRVHRLTIPHFKPFFQVRIESLEKVVKDCRQDTTFETYAAGVFAPSLTDPDFIVPHGSELETDQSQDADPAESVKNKDDKEELFAPARLIRRMSGRSRKSSTKHISTPPSSPKAWKQL